MTINHDTWFKESEYLAQLAIKQRRRQLSAAEQEALDKWLDAGPGNREWFEQLTDEKQRAEELALYNSFDSTKSLERTLEKIRAYKEQEKVFEARKAVNTKRNPWILRLSAACLVGIAILMAWKYIIRKENDVQPAGTVTITNLPAGNAVVPGSEKAELTLANGTKVNLDSTRNEPIGKQGNVEIRNKNGQVIFVALPGNNNVATDTNMLKTPRGGKYGLLLPDGSKVLLNASSSIRFPSQFAGNRREVEITGEAYFDVNADASRPFAVKINGTIIEALGTRFNVNAYTEEGKIKTSLIEGKLNVSSGDKKQPLKALQTALIVPGESIKITSTLTAKNSIGWTTGNFILNESSTTDIMNQVSRWYDLKIVYKDTPDVVLNGKISRSTPIDVLLNLLIEQGLNNKRTDRTVTVFK